MIGQHKEELIRALAAAIDADDPPGLAAVTLARSTISLIQDREPKQMLAIAAEFNVLGPSRTRSRKSWTTRPDART